MHTRVDIMLLAPQWDEQHLLFVTDRIYDLVAHLESIGNCFDPNSEISRYNDATEKSTCNLSNELSEILRLCNEYKSKTHGLFDINVPKNPGEKPCLNLSGILKGYTLDKIASLLQAEGITDYLLSLGTSSILAHGNGPDGNGWSIMPDAKGLTPEGKTAIEPITLHNECLTISGNDTEERTHIINPHTGELIKGHRMTAVITPTATEGEAFSTAGFIDPDIIPYPHINFLLGNCRTQKITQYN